MLTSTTHPTIDEVLRVLEEVAPPGYQESYDNAGLLVGDRQARVTGVITCLDCTEEVVEEAASKRCNLIVAHHPIWFKPLRRLTGSGYVERTILAAIRKDIAIYAIHTNLDNVHQHGVNARIAEQLGMINTRILAPKAVWRRFALPVNDGEVSALEASLSGAGVRQLRIAPAASSGQFILEGLVAEAGVARVERLAGIHPPVWHTVEGGHPEIGAGLVGELRQPMDEQAFLSLVKSRMRTPCIRHTRLLGNPVRKIAICGGAGSFLLGQAIRSGVQVFVSSDFKYHEFFDADGQLLVADIGHFESEQFTIDLLAKILSDNFSNFAVHLTEVVTNPVFYQC